MTMVEDRPEAESRAAAPRRSPLALLRDHPEQASAAAALMFFAAGATAEFAGGRLGLAIALYLGCYVVGGWSPAASGLASLRERKLDVDVLMVVAAIAAAAIGEWFDGALLILIFATSGALEGLIMHRTETGIRALMRLAPEEATQVDAGGRERQVRVADLVSGDVVVVRPGERIPADATVTFGESDVDQSSLTGEPLPVPRRPGDDVLAGTINGQGLLHARVTRTGDESVIARVAQLVEEAIQTKARRQMFLERFEQHYSIGVVVATVLLLTVPLALGMDFRETLLRAMTFMVVASPCAVLLATMPPLLAGISKAVHHGVLVRGTAVMEDIAGIDAVAFDKTGTLTTGVPVVTDVVVLDGVPRERLLAIAAAAESGSEHPVGRSIVTHARDRGVPVAQPRHFKALPGRGVEAVVDGDRVRIGNATMFAGALNGARAPMEELQATGKTAVAVEINGEVVGLIAVSDEARPENVDLVRDLHDLGVRDTLVLTGDSVEVAETVAAASGIATTHARLLPEDKTAHVRALQERGRRVAYVGDGVNDAPALAAADVGFAMGRQGTHVALETADAVLVHDQLSRLPWLLQLSRTANRLVRQSLVFALSVIAVLVYANFTGNLTLTLGVLFHEGSTLLVALNGLRVLRMRGPAHPGMQAPAQPVPAAAT